MEKPVICIVGPTATGKTALAQKLAETLEGEVVSADSMQIYRGMDIGTGKIPQNERTVPYHGLDIIEPGVPYSASLYQKDSRTWFSDIASRNKQSILCGGTGLYVRAAIDDYQFVAGEQKHNPVRTHYTELLDEIGSHKLWELLAQRDKESSDLIHPHNTRRVIRAFEMLEEGTSYARVHAGLSSIPQAIPALFFGLAMEPLSLRSRIEVRVDKMREAGLVAEVKDLLQKGFRQALTAQQAIGYKEIVCSLEGNGTLDEAFEQIKTATRRYAKRQRTWFRKDERITWIEANSTRTEDQVEQVLQILNHNKLFCKHKD